MQTTITVTVHLIRADNYALIEYTVTVIPLDLRTGQIADFACES